MDLILTGKGVTSNGRPHRTPFNWACFRGHYKVVELLIEKSNELNVDLINCRDEGGGTPFLVACKKGHLKVAELLAQNSAETNAKTVKGQTAFHLACIYGQTEIVEMLMDNAKAYKIDFTAEDERCFTGLQYAISWKRQDVVDLIKTKETEIQTMNLY